MTKKRMRLKGFCKLILWPIGLISIYGLFRNLLNEKWLPQLWPFLDLSEGVWLKISVSLIALILLFFGWLSKRKHYSYHHIGILLAIIALTVLLYFDNTSTPFLLYLGVIPCWFVLLGAYLAGIVVHYLYDLIVPLFRKRIETEALSVVRLFQDIPVSSISSDRLLYDGFAKRITSAIINNTWDESFSIGLTGTWGAGKTSMLLFVKEVLKEHTDIIIIEFNPRQSSSVQEIQKDFLSQLAEALGHYHSGAVRVAHRYMQAIGVLPDNLWAARLLGSVSDVDIQQSRERIVEVIEQVGKKIVVLIDDFDRLTGEEIQEVLKLIDKNAAFPWTFFVTAYDKKQTNQVISAYLGHVAEEEAVDYTDKYFNIEVSLPKRRNSNYVKVLRECLYALADNSNISFKRKDIDDALPRLYPFISKCLPSIRDVKRYANLISLTLPQVEDDVLLGDFLLVTLIRYRYPDEYKNLSQYKYVVREGGNIPENKCLKLNSGSFEKVRSTDILKVLFNGKEPSYKGVSHVNSFSNYFYDIDSGHLSYRELSGLLDPDIEPEEFRTKIETLVRNDNEKSDFVEFVLSFEDQIQNMENASWYFRFFLMARTFCDSKDLYIASLSYLLKENVPENIKKFGFSNEREYVGFLKDVLNDKYDYRLSIEVLHDALHAVNTLDAGEMPTLVFAPKDLMAFAKKKLEKAITDISEGDASTENVFRAYKACVIEFILNGGGESVDVEATEMLKEAIRKQPVFFFKDMLAHRKAPNAKSAIQFYMEKIPYADVFKNTEGFVGFINEMAKSEGGCMMLCLSQYAELCRVQNTWEPTMTIKGDIAAVKQHDYEMYNKLFEGEPVDA